MGKTPEAGQPLRSPKPAARRTPHGHGPVRQRRGAPPWVFNRRRRSAAAKLACRGGKAQEPQYPQTPGKNSTPVIMAAQIIPVR